MDVVGTCSWLFTTIGNPGGEKMYSRPLIGRSWIDWFVMPSEIGSMYRGDGRQPPMTGWTGLWMLLPIVGWFVWTVKVQGALNRYWESKALTA